MKKDEIPEELRHALATQNFKRIVVFSGAGMSADSGIPTFRSGGNSFWGKFDPQQLATPEGWERDKALVWGWYEWRRGQVMSARPNPGHLAVTQLQQRFGAKVVTQNVDDLHERAGVIDVLHLHGSLFAARCATCGMQHELKDPPPSVQRRLRPPRCLTCGGDVRPGVVWFGESLDDAYVHEASRQIRESDLLVIVGTSGVVQPAAGLVRLAPEGATIVEINPQPADANAFGTRAYRWAVSAAVGLPAFVEIVVAAEDEAKE